MDGRGGAGAFLQVEPAPPERILKSQEALVLKFLVVILLRKKLTNNTSFPDLEREIENGK